MEVAGLVFGAVGMVTLWNTCVQVFDTVAAGRNYTLDTEIVRVKLEVERARLLVWGQAVGLANVERGHPSPDLLIDPRLNKPEIRVTVMRLLGCVQQVFEDTNSLQKKYGLKPLPLLPNPAGPDGAGPSTQSRDQATTLTPTGSDQFLFGAVFKRAYANLQLSAKEYKSSATLRKKTAWAISDKAKFAKLIAEIRGFNDSLVSLFPDVLSLTKDQLHEDIAASDEIRSLQLLEEASAEDHNDISDCASVRLTDLNVTAISSVREYGEIAAKNPVQPKDEAKLPPNDDGDQQISELEKAIDQIELFSKDKFAGALTGRVYQSDWSAHCSASVFWEGTKDDTFSWNDRLKGFVQLPHEALEIYHRKTFLKKSRRDSYSNLTDETYVFIDIESNPDYENIHPGTITVEGFGMECWDYQVNFGKAYDDTVFVNCAKLPDIPAKKLLRRLHELKTNPGKLGWHREQDEEDLYEFTGIKKYASRTWDDYNRFGGPISDLYSLIHRRDIFVNFSGCSSISMVALGASERSFGVWNFLWQVIVGKELARRLELFPDASVSGFTSDVLNTLIVSDLWIRNVDVVLVNVDKDKESKAEETGDDNKEKKAKEGAEAEEVKNESSSSKKEQEEKKEDKNAPWDNAFDIQGKSVQFHSRVHDKQVEGLLRFAEILRWPFMNETRDYAEDVYGNLRSGSTVPLEVWDWIFGMVLPGKFSAFTVMATLVLCTPSLKDTLGIAYYLEQGLSLPQKSYWRSRTVLGRILGCLPGVKSTCGWIGPCPPIEGPQSQWIRLKARRVAPVKPNNDRTIYIGLRPDEGDETVRLRPGEDVYQWMAEMKDESRWTQPEPPVTQMTTCTVTSIRVKALPLDIKFATKSDKMTKKEIEQQTEYRASITFKIDNEASITYTLYTNPVFVTPPSCTGGPHPVHMRELRKFQRHIWNIEDLKDASTEDEDNHVFIINATGRGAETLARAWCSERGKNAIIRRASGPCFLCAYTIASDKGLGINVLIWVS